MIRFILICMVVTLWAGIAHADQDSTNSALPKTTTDVQGDQIVHQDNLATYLGLTDKDVEFGAVRNFRADQLDDMSVDN